MIVLDACVLIAFADPANVFNADAARILTTAEPLVISALSGAEIMVHPLPDQQHHWWEMLADFGIDVVPVTRDDMEALAAVRRESGLKMPDAIILWLAETRGAAVASFDQRLLTAAQDREIRTVG